MEIPHSERVISAIAEVCDQLDHAGLDGSDPAILLHHLRLYHKDLLAELGPEVVQAYGQMRVSDFKVRR